MLMRLISYISYTIAFKERQNGFPVFGSYNKAATTICFAAHRLYPAFTYWAAENFI